MPLFRRPRVVRRRNDGTYDLNLDDQFRDVVRSLMDQLVTMLDEAPDDPSMRRLRPPAYLEEPEADAAYQLLAGEELRASHHAAIDRVLSSVDATVLSEDDLWGWLQALNAVRLVVGTRLDISEDDHAGRRQPADEHEASLWAIYDLTTALQHEVVTGLQR